MSSLRASPTSHSYFSQGLRLHYLDWGNPEAPPLLLVHGNRDHCHNWDWVAQELRDEYHILAPDFRGHGDSERLIFGAMATRNTSKGVTIAILAICMTLLSSSINKT